MVVGDVLGAVGFQIDQSMQDVEFNLELLKKQCVF